MLKMKYSTIKNKTLPFIKKSGRILDYYLILNLIEESNYEKEIIAELLKYQNPDGGFGNALEPDNQMNESSTLSTNIACEIIDTLTINEKKKVIEDIIKYFESTYKENTKSFDFVTKEIMNYPHAVWWNFESIDSFGYLNPNPEIIGFLCKHSEYLNYINPEELKKYMIDYIKDYIYDCKEEHSLYSIRRMIDRMNCPNTLEIEELFIKQIQEVIVIDEEKWGKYVAEPINFINNINHPLYSKYKDSVSKNLQFTLDNIGEDNVWFPKWGWFQYEDVFEKTAKYQWMGYLTYKNIKLLINFGLVDFNE